MSSKTLHIAQHSETPVTAVRRSALSYRYAYARAAETREAGDTGQDYLTIIDGETSLIFALCDGVSQSFFGDLAARFLGDSLAQWLREDVDDIASADKLQQNLTAYLASLTTDATRAVETLALPENIPAIFRDVLEEKRAIGSQSTFVCGRIDLPDARFASGRLLLAWLGDSKLRLWRDDGVEVELGDTFRTEERWSTSRGVLGSVHVLASRLQRDGVAIERLMAYSDGLLALDRESSVEADGAIRSLIEAAGRSLKSDDVSYLEIWLGAAPAVPAQAQVSLEAPKINVGQIPGSIRASWRPVSGASSYEVRMGEESQTVNEALWEALAPDGGTHSIQVRALRGEEAGPWSEAKVISVPTPTVPEPTAEPEASDVIAHDIEPSPPEQTKRGAVGFTAVTVGAILMVSLLALGFGVIGGIRVLSLGRSTTMTPVAPTTAPVTLPPTANPVPTDTPTPTHTLTPMHTATSTVTPTATEPPTNTPTPSPTATHTPTGTAVPTVTETPTGTLTPSPGASSALTATPAPP